MRRRVSPATAVFAVILAIAGAVAAWSVLSLDGAMDVVVEAPDASASRRIAEAPLLPIPGAAALIVVDESPDAVPTPDQPTPTAPPAASSVLETTESPEPDLPKAAIAGRVVAEDGETPVAHARVTLVQGVGALDSRETTTARAGRLQFPS